MTLVYLVAAWVAGLFLAQTQAPVAPWLLAATTSLCLAWWQRHHPTRRLVLLCTMMLTLGAARLTSATQPLHSDHVASYADTGYFTVIGTISRDPDIRDQHVNLHIKTESISSNFESHQTEGLILAQVPRYGDYTYGDRVQIKGSLLTPPEFDDFSYRDYLARRGIRAMMPNAQIEILENRQGSPWYQALYSLKNKSFLTINRLLPSPEAPLLSGILLGIESGIPHDVREDFNTTGTSHVIAISGSNIIIVIQVLLSLLTPIVGIRHARYITLAGISAYTLFVGADPAVVRAALMGSLSLMAMQTGRRAHGLTSLALATWLMTLWNPLTLWDIGFQLSVAATLGLIAFSRPFTTALEALLQYGFSQRTARAITRMLSEAVTVSLAAQITTTPLILVYFGRLSLISFVANILIVPAQAFIMTLGWLAVIGSMIWNPLGRLLAWIAWLPVTYTLRIVRSLADINWAATDLRLEPTYAWLAYAVLTGITLFIIQHPEDRNVFLRRVAQRVTTLSIVAISGVVALLVWIAAWSQPDGKLHVWFLDVGHGHAVFIQTPNGAQILVDGGPNPTQLRSAMGDSLSYHDDYLDALIITQPTKSAINALPALLDRYEVGLVLTSGQSSDSREYQTLSSTLTAKRVKVATVSAGYQLETGDGVSISILHPPDVPTPDADPKDEPLVLKLTYGSATFLLMPDLLPSVHNTIITEGWFIGSTVLELPSYGSEKANPKEFIKRVNPQIAVVGVGAGNRSNFPDISVQENIREITGQPVYRTDKNGTVEIVSDGKTLAIYSER